MRLLRVELTRLLMRRAVVLLLLGCLLVPAAITVAVIWDSRPFSAAEIARAEQDAARDAEQPWVEREIADCQDDPRLYGIEDAEATDLAARCRELVTPTAENYLWRSQLDLGSQLDESFPAIVIIMTVLLVLLGTTFVGADWNSGSMSNQLLFEPRRGRIWLAKAGAVLLTALVTAAVVCTALWLALWLVAEARGIPADAHTIAFEPATGEQLLRELGLASARGVLFAGAAALGGYALTNLLRSTVATLGVLVALIVVGSYVVYLMPIEGNGRWIFHHNVLALLSDGYTYYDPSLERACTDPQYLADGCSGEARLGVWHGAAYLGSLLALAVVPSWLSFRRRDVP